MRAESLKAIVVALNEANVRYLVVGGLAVVAHGYVRYTVDVDLVVALNPDNIRPALSALENLGYRPRVPVKLQDFADEKIRESWVRDKGMVVFQLISDQHIDTNVDLFVTIPFDFDAQWQKADWEIVVGYVKAPVLALDELLGDETPGGSQQGQNRRGRIGKNARFEMNNPEIPNSADDWHCGGWEGAEMATYQHMMSLTFEQKIGWLEAAQENVAAMHGWEAARQNSGTSVRPPGAVPRN